MKSLVGCEEIVASSFLSALFTPEKPMVVFNLYGKQPQQQQQNQVVEKTERKGRTNCKNIHSLTPKLLCRFLDVVLWPAVSDEDADLKVKEPQDYQANCLLKTKCVDETLPLQTFGTSRLDAELNKLSATYLRPAPVRVFPPL